MSNSHLRVFEPAIPYFQRTGEWWQGGVNNTIIILGTDRVSSVGPASKNDGLGHVNAPGNGVGTGAIMMIAGRKDAEQGNPDINADLTSFYLSMKTNVDENLKLNNVVSASNSVPAAALKSDHLRFVYRESTKIASQDAANYMYFDKKKVEVKVGANVTVTATEDTVTVTVGSSKVVAKDGKVTIEATTIELGEGSGGGEGIILGKTFMNFFNNHIHITPTGPSQKPLMPMPATQVSAQSFVKY